MSLLEYASRGFAGSTSKAFRSGTYRVVAPVETVARARRFMAPLGITRIANITGLDRIGVPVVMVCRPNARSLSVAQGKGLELDAARASGLMESIEAYHAEHIMLPLLLCSYEQLRYTHTVADPNQLPRPRTITSHNTIPPQDIAEVLCPYAASHPHTMPQINTSNTHSERFDPHEELLWIEGEDLLRGRRVWLPYDLVHLNYTSGPWMQRRRFILSSNGLASGNHPLEAMCHGICEVVERDAATLWSLQSETARAATRLDLDTVNDPACRSVLQKLADAGVAAAAWEITSDIGIPAFRCLLTEAQDNPMARLPSAAGTGCHPFRAIALLRALTEAVQTRLTLIAGTRDDVTRTDLQSYYQPERIEVDRALVLSETGRRAFPGPSWDGDTLEDDMWWLLDRLGTVGIESVIAVDLTKPELGIPVVRIVIPGLEPSPLHAMARYGTRALRMLRNRA